MHTQFVTFQLEVTARVDAVSRRDRSDIVGVPDQWVYDVREVSGVSIEGIDIPIASVCAPLYELVEELAAETAISKGEWHD